MIAMLFERCQTAAMIDAGESNRMFMQCLKRCREQLARGVSNEYWNKTTIK